MACMPAVSRPSASSTTASGLPAKRRSVNTSSVTKRRRIGPLIVPRQGAQSLHTKTTRGETSLLMVNPTFVLGARPMILPEGPNCRAHVLASYPVSDKYLTRRHQFVLGLDQQHLAGAGFGGDVENTEERRPSGRHRFRHRTGAEVMRKEQRRDGIAGAVHHDGEQRCAQAATVDSVGHHHIEAVS